jgi:hypothetical protein
MNWLANVQVGQIFEFVKSTEVITAMIRLLFQAALSARVVSIRMQQWLDGAG